MRTSDDQIDPIADIIGIIMPHNWDEDGKAIQIAVYTIKEEVYPVEQNQKEKELFNFIGKKVAVKGKILRRDGGSSSIIVKNYSLQAEDAGDENNII